MWRKFGKNIFRVVAAATMAGVGTLEGIPRLMEWQNLQERRYKDGVEEVEVSAASPLPNRNQMIQRLKETQLDVLVVGGGATGCGVALDAASRGLSTGLVERADFAAGASSRSTKLVHGGVRYLQAAVFKLDLGQLRLVTEALSERAALLRAAPHLTKPLPILLPVYKVWEIPYFWAGIKLYDLVSGRQLLRASYVIGPGSALAHFPELRSRGLRGGIVYYDGQQDDARVCLALALSATRHGAAVGNHLQVECLKTDSVSGRVCGAVVRDLLNNEQFVVRAHTVVNAAGPFTDSLRAMADTDTAKICQPSSGVHLVLQHGLCSAPLPTSTSTSGSGTMGLLDPHTSDGRILFLLPWMGKTLAGTTDRKCGLTHAPEPTRADVDYILDEMRNKYFPDSSHSLSIRNVSSAWSGIRPLVRDPSAKSTQSLSRSHVVEVSGGGGLVTVAGGKWTTYRIMAEHTIDRLLQQLPSRSDCLPCQTRHLLLEGASGFCLTTLTQQLLALDLDSTVADHLAHNYGTNCLQLVSAQSPASDHTRLSSRYPFIEAEVRYACRAEYACTVIDVIANRVRIAFLDAAEAKKCIPRVTEIMTEELGWSQAQSASKMAAAHQFIDKQMGFQFLKDAEKATENSEL